MQTIVKVETRDINMELMREQLVSTFGANFLGFEYAGYMADETKFTTERTSQIKGSIFIPRLDGDSKLVTRRSRVDGVMVPTAGYIFVAGELRFHFEVDLTTQEETTLTTNIANHNELNTTQSQSFEDQDEIDYPRINVLRKIANRSKSQNDELMNRMARTIMRQGKDIQEF